MAETLTPNFGWTKPDPGASANTWGTTLNATTDKVDAQCFANQQSGVPVGSGALWFAAAPPTNWLICDGSSLATATYPALFAVIGYTFGGSGANFNLPNFADRFPVGVGSNALAAAGGAATVTLDATMIPPHAHPITDVAHNHGVNQYYHDHSWSQSPHGHGASQDAHNHTVGGSFGYLTGPVGGPNPMVNVGSTTTSTAQPNVYVSAQNANINFAGVTSQISLQNSGTNLSTTQNAGGGAAHENRPPFLGINFIIKYQ